MEHWKFLLPWYALLFPVSQLTLWCYLMRTILSDEVASAAMDRHRRFAAGAMRRCRPSSLQGAAGKARSFT